MDDEDTLSDDMIAALSFEDALLRLEDTIRRLESGDVPLDQSIALYTDGEKLRAHCEKRLADAKARIEKVVAKADGSLSSQPLDE